MNETKNDEWFEIIWKDFFNCFENCAVYFLFFFFFIVIFFFMNLWGYSFVQPAAVACELGELSYNGY